MKRLLLATLVLLLASCEKEIEFKGDIQKPRLVAFSELEAGKPLNLSLSATMPVFGRQSLVETEDFSEGIHDARAVVTAIIGNERFTLEPYRDSIYLNPYCPDAGDKVRFEVSYPGYESVSGSTVVPGPIDAVLVSCTVDRENNMQTVRLRIRDRKGADFYRIQIYDEIEGEGIAHYYDDNWKETWSQLEPYHYFQSYWMESNDPVFGVTDAAAGVIEELIGDAPQISGFFTDSVFDGEEYEVSVKSPWSQWSHEGPDEQGQWVTCTPFVSIQAVSRELFMYGSSLWSYRADGDDSLFSEPTQIISNVNNGTGCIGAFSAKVIKLNFTEWI